MERIMVRLSSRGNLDWGSGDVQHIVISSNELVGEDDKYWLFPCTISLQYIQGCCSSGAHSLSSTLSCLCVNWHTTVTYPHVSE